MTLDRNMLTTTVLTTSIVEPQSTSNNLTTKLPSSSLSSNDLITTTRLKQDSLRDIPKINTVYDRYGDTPGTAGDLGRLSGTQKINGWVGSSDITDFYKISVFPKDLSGVSLNVVLRGLTADADLRIIQDINGNGLVDNGEVLATSARGFTSDEMINLSFFPTTECFIAVNRYGETGDTHYQLLISDSTPEYVLGSNILGIETELGTLSTTQIFSGFLDNNNSVDTYHFTVNPSGLFDNVNVTLSGLGDNAYIRLIRDANGNHIVDQGEDLGGSYRSGSAAEFTNWNLGAGDYFLQVSQQTILSNTSYHLGISTGDWFNQNLGDLEIMGEARFAYYNNTGIDRNEMIGLLRSAQDGTIVDITELSDLRKIVAFAGGLGITDDVRVLSNKVVNFEIANDRANIGNLIVDSNDAHLERLIGKWFLGNDRPIAWSIDKEGNRQFQYNYRYVSGSLFQNGISYLDVDQNNCGDCYFLANLAAAALQSPNTISNMFIDNGDGTFTVRLFNQGVADYVTVDRLLPTNVGTAVYAGWGGGYSDNVNNELWVALAEKAYAQFNESGWIGQDGTNSYNGMTMGKTGGDGINGGGSHIALSQITNQAFEWGIIARPVSSSLTQFLQDWVQLNATITNIIINFRAGDLVTFSTTTPQAGSGIEGNHVYTLLDYDAVSDRFKIYNPWNYNGDAMAERWISRDQLIDNFAAWTAIA
jgi:Calpain family cysteine protease